MTTNPGVHLAREVARAAVAPPISPFFIAEVMSVAGYLITILPEGLATTPGSQLIGTAAGYTPEVGDRVICAWIAGEPFALATVATSAGGGGSSGPLEVEAHDSRAFVIKTTPAQGDYDLFVFDTTAYVGYWRVGTTHIGLNSSAVEKWRIDSQSGAGTFASLNTPIMAHDTQDSASDSSNAVAGTYDLNVDADLTLPSGTWDVTVLGFGSYYSSVAGSSIRQRCYLSGYSGGPGFGNLLQQPCPGSSDRRAFFTSLNLTGIVGGLTVTGEVRYTPVTNTANASGGMVYLIARRTA